MIMHDCYINGIGSVSVQDHTEVYSFFEKAEVIKVNKAHATKPNYRDFIKPNMIRRMATGVKMGVVASTIALKDAQLDEPGAIVSGTGMGCLIDSEKFLKSIVDNKELYLTPTAFIQSTHNTVGAQIALGLQCNAYNISYVHSSTSFEVSLIDTLLMIQNHEEDSVLVGGVDELGGHSTELFKLIDFVKREEVVENIEQTKTKGAVFSEGSQFFVVENKKTDRTYAKLMDVEINDNLPNEEIQSGIIAFLNKNGLEIKDIDLVMLGVNGDEMHDQIYDKLSRTLLKNTPQAYYKHLSGEYNTSSAFGMWVASQVIKDQRIPEIIKLNTVKNNSIQHVLLYNQYRGEDHSFTLLSRC